MDSILNMMDFILTVRWLTAQHSYRMSPTQPLETHGIPQKSSLEIVVGVGCNVNVFSRSCLRIFTWRSRVSRTTTSGESARAPSHASSSPAVIGISIGWNDSNGARASYTAVRRPDLAAVTLALLLLVQLPFAPGLS